MDRVDGRDETLLAYGGALLALAGGLFLVAGVLHPHGEGPSYDAATASMLQATTWSAAHWFGLVSTVLLAWAVWVLVDAGWAAGSSIARAGARLTIIAGLFMAAQMSVEIAAGAASSSTTTSGTGPLVELLEVMQVVGWPALGLGLGLLALGSTHAAPPLLAWLAAAGGVAAGLGGVLVMGFHLVAAAPLFAGTVALAPWLVWSGARIVRHGRSGPPGPGATRRADPARAR